MQMFLGTRQLPDGSVMPAATTAAEALAALPAPKESPWGVAVSVAGGELVAVLRFEGYITPATAEKAKEQLLAALKAGKAVDSVALLPVSTWIINCIPHATGMPAVISLGNVSVCFHPIDSTLPLFS